MIPFSGTGTQLSVHVHCVHPESLPTYPCEDNNVVENNRNGSVKIMREISSDLNCFTLTESLKPGGGLGTNETGSDRGFGGGPMS